MYKTLKNKHIGHYFSLLGILAATFIGFFVFSYDKNFQLALITASCVSYFVWGIIHHILHKNLSFEVVIEYLIFSSIGFVIGVSVIFRA
jgi:hypothetical protein